MIRVVLAEDSPTLQELLRSLLEADSGIEVVGIACDGSEALALTRKKKPDVVVMDVNMPVMNGLEATRQIMSEVPTPIVIVSATLDVQEVEVSMAALDAGALTILPKPHGPGSDAFIVDSRRFVTAVKNMAGVKVVTRRRATIAPGKRSVEEPSLPVRVRLVAVAASTGGPMALGKILGELPQEYP
ncbi:MAG: response regulator, partial [Woeseia sp.]